MGFLLKEEKENLLTEYNVLKEEIMDRDYKTWVINAILIIGSLIAAFSPVAENFNGAVLSVILVASAVILHATSERVNKICQLRVNQVVKQLRITGLTKMYEGRIAGQWWYTIRRNVAYALFTILLGVYLFLLSANVYVMAMSILVGVILLMVKEGFWRKLELIKDDAP